MKLKHWIRIGIFLIMSALIVWWLNGFLKTVEDREVSRMYGFYKEPENSIDVVLIGTSEVYTSFYAPLAYEKYGFTSYPMAVSGMPGAFDISVIRECMQTQSPQLYVIDLWGFTYETIFEEVDARRWIDPLDNASPNKKQTIEELVPEELKESFYHPFLKYHANWINIGDCVRAVVEKRDIDKYGYSITKSFSTRSHIFNSRSPKNTSYEISKVGMEQLKKLMDFVKEKGIENVLFLRSPEYDLYNESESLKKAVAMIKEYGYDYISPHDIQEELGIDRSSCYYDPGHLNIYGALIETEYIAKYINDNYELRRSYSDEVVAEWERCASYNDEIIEYLKQETDKDTDIIMSMHRVLIH